VSLRESCEAKTRRRGICVNIVDTGAGIPPEHAKRLFEPFFTTKPVKGAGLGLWSSKGIVQKYEGVIRFRSLHLNCARTTCFSVFIPGLTTANGAEVEPKLRSQQWKVQAASA
jgi:signal transduction histidine kinase